MTRKEQIKSAYKLTGGHASFYDGMMTYSTLPGKAICRIVWNMDGEKNLRYLERALSGIPEDFSGKLLEVPVGTGVLTMPVYRELPDADITCLDYSENMMASAQKKAKAVGIRNITFMQGDVGALPFADGSFDIVLSLNGFHAFPDKEAAYRETFRVLKPGGLYILSDTGIGGVGGWIDNHILFRLARSGDCHTTNRHGIARMMEQAGFTVTESRQIQGMIYTVTGKKGAK